MQHVLSVRAEHPHSILRSFPNLVEDLGGQCGLVLRKEAAVVLLHDIGRILNGIARLLVGSGLLQNMRRQNVPQVMRSMRQEALDRTPSGIGIIDAVTLDDSPPSLVECGRIVSSISTGRLYPSAEGRLP